MPKISKQHKDILDKFGKGDWLWVSPSEKEYDDIHYRLYHDGIYGRLTTKYAWEFFGDSLVEKFDNYLHMSDEDYNAVQLMGNFLGEEAWLK